MLCFLVCRPASVSSIVVLLLRNAFRGKKTASKPLLCRDPRGSKLQIKTLVKTVPGTRSSRKRKPQSKLFHPPPQIILSVARRRLFCPSRAAYCRSSPPLAEKSLTTPLLEPATSPCEPSVEVRRPGFDIPVCNEGASRRPPRPVRHPDRPRPPGVLRTSTVRPPDAASRTSVVLVQVKPGSAHYGFDEIPQCNSSICLLPGCSASALFD